MVLQAEDDLDLVSITCDETDQLASLSLVLYSVGIDHLFNERTNELLVAARDAEAAVFHLNQYQSENLNWPPPPPPRPAFHAQTPPTLFMMGLLALFFSQTGPWSAHSPWFTRGAIDSRAILDHGEWWRLITALTLHADLVHLTGNCLIGGVMIHFLGKTMGYGLSWLLLLLSGFTGNLLNIIIRQQPHLSVGLSTLVFAAIGMFTGLQIARLKAHPVKDFVLPIGAGVGLLAFLGSEGVRTDLGAHFFGFASGICCSILLGRTGVLEKTDRPWLQAILFCTALAILILCWTLALRSHTVWLQP